MHEKLHVWASDRKLILDDIFGKSDGSSHVCGLVDAESDAIFDQDVKRLQTQWEKLAPGFHAWFVRNQSPDFKKCMMAPIRRKAGIKAPPETFTNNPNESLNKAVKTWQNFEKKTWVEFVEKLSSLVQSQITEAQKAIIW